MSEVPLHSSVISNQDALFLYFPQKPIFKDICCGPGEVSSIICLYLFKVDKLG